jgi:hypothetical protein
LEQLEPNAWRQRRPRGSEGQRASCWRGRENERGKEVVGLAKRTENVCRILTKTSFSEESEELIGIGGEKDRWMREVVKKAGFLTER